jgi:hypothetical protein
MEAQMSCRRCGTDQEPIDTISVRVNDISEYLRAPLCCDCRALLRKTLEEVLAAPAGTAGRRSA